MGAGTRVFTYSGDACHSAKVMLDLAGVICTFNIVPIFQVLSQFEMIGSLKFDPLDAAYNASGRFGKCSYNNNLP
jgi:hypothetical protein